MRLEASNTPPQSMSSPRSVGTNVPSDKQRAVVVVVLVPPPSSFHHTRHRPTSCITGRHTDPHPQQSRRGWPRWEGRGVVNPIQTPKMKSVGYIQASARKSPKKNRNRNRQTMRSGGRVCGTSTYYLSSGNFGGIGSFEVKAQKSVSKA